MNTFTQSTTKFFSFSFLAAVLLMAVVGCASTSKQSSTGEYIDDTVITTKVKAAILDEKELKVTEMDA